MGPAPIMSPPCGPEALSMNAKRLDRASQVDFCGACHMTWVDVQLQDVGDGSTVRFPAYRLMNSRCWEMGDGRITTGCHDPHHPVVRVSPKGLGIPELSAHELYPCLTAPPLPSPSEVGT
jgi:hypothetical protein